MTIGSLPEAYFETLSYYESLCWIYKYLNETVVPALNNNAEATKELQAILDSIEKYIQNYEKDIADLSTRITNNTSAIANLTGRVNANYTELDKRIDEIELGEINVYNPLSGRYENINIVIEELYELNRSNALTATEFDGLELTATAFDGYDITAIQFDLTGKTILV
jgi:hypothetical protein